MLLHVATLEEEEVSARLRHVRVNTTMVWYYVQNQLLNLANPIHCDQQPAALPMVMDTHYPQRLVRMAGADGNGLHHWAPPIAREL